MPRRIIVIVQADRYHYPCSNICTTPALITAEVFAANFKVINLHDCFQ